MKICFLADAVSPHTQKWATYFATDGHEVHVISFRYADIPGCTVHHIAPPFINTDFNHLYVGRSTFQKAAYLFCARSVRQMVQRVNPDILHALLATSYGWVGAVSGFHPFVISALGSEVVVCPQSLPFYGRLLRHNFKVADAVTATSDFLASLAQPFCPAGTTVETVAFGVDMELFTPGGRTYSNDEKLAIGTVKILENNYGIERLIRAFAQVASRKRDLDVSLLIAGGGSLEQSLKKLAQRLGISQSITFTGNLPNAQVMDFLHLIDIFVSLPESESFGVSVVEASACGIPVVASNVGGLPEVVIDGNTGYLVHPFDTDAAADRIIELAANSSLRQDLGLAGRQFVEHKYDMASSGERMISVYERAASPAGVSA